MTRFSSWLLLLLLFGSFLGTAAWLLRARVEAGRDLPRYSVYSEEPEGLAETARFLRKLGWEPVTLTRPIRQLRPSRQPRLLVLVEPQPGGLALLGTPDIPPAEVRGLLRWVAEGNTLLLCGRTFNALHAELKVNIRNDREDTEDTTVRAADVVEAGVYTEQMGRVLVEGGDLVVADQGLPLWTLDEGQAGAVLVRHGQGRVFVVADPSVLTRRGLVRGDNALFLYNVARLHARDGRVYFDEYYHGLESGGGFWGYLGYHGLHWALLPLLLVLLAAGWSVGVRLGPAVPRPPALQADAVAYASSLARIYQRAGVRHLLAEVVARGFVIHLTTALKLRRTARPQEILAGWGKHLGAEASSPAVQELEVLLRHANQLRQGRPSEGELLRSAQQFERFLKEHFSTPPSGGH